MSIEAKPPDLIISLSRDKVTLNLLELPETGRSPWKFSYEVGSLFLDEKISLALDKALTDHPPLIDQFPCVEMIILDRPNVSIPSFYIQNSTAADIASRYLRVRAGDTFTTDENGSEAVMCYTVPSTTLQVLKEYYSNIRLTHLSSLLWNSINAALGSSNNESLTCLTVLHDILVVMASKNGKLVFSKNFTVRDEADLFYYTIACSRMLKSDAHWLVTIQGEDFSFEMPGESILKIDQRLSLPSLHDLIAQFKQCGS